MTIKVGIVMDPIESIKTYKDSSFAMMLAAQKRGWEIHYMQQVDLWLYNGRAFGRSQIITLVDQKNDYVTFHSTQEQPLADLDVILLRTDPPFDMEYVYTTYILERAQVEGVLIVNDPQGLRDANEKVYTAWFPQCTPTTIIARDSGRIKSFLAEHKDIIVKPLDMMGGSSIFRLREGDANINVTLEVMTQHDQQYITAQRFITEIVETGDKRILLIDGEPVPYSLARMLQAGETRANMAVGGKPVGVPLTERDRWICAQVGPTLKEKGLIFVGLDVIGDYLTEVNVTSPTGIRELDAQFDLDIASQLMDAIEKRLHTNNS